LVLTAGTRLGVYEVTAQIGAGGMGEVYRATDRNLKRSVAIKVLPASMATDTDRLVRFQREAEVLAALNHPNIAAIYGLEKAPDFTAIVMELVEGEDLSQRIGRGAIPIDEAFLIAKQIAEALEAAHEQGIIHRDLKPANIKVRPDGTVKVLDFGLAKLAESGEAGPAARNLTQSPTITSPAMMTGAGMILGTAAYLSPEQARGKTVDKRADIWAFGVVVFEMLTGCRAFVGDDISITLAAIMMREPDWRALPAPTPLGLRRLLTRCLKKDPKARMRDIGDARLQIEELLSGAPEGAGVPAIPHARSLWQRAWPWASTGALVLALMLALWAPWRPAPQPEQLQRLSVELGAEASLVTDFVGSGGSAAALSPDGSVLAFVARKAAAGNASELYVRRLDQLHAAPFAGTEGARSPFFSPDGQWIAFFAGGKLKKVAATVGAAVTLCDAPNDRGGTWSEDGSILFATAGTGLWRVSSAGGAAQALTTPDPAAGEVGHLWPQALPGGEAVLFTAVHAASNLEDAAREADLVVQRLPGGPRKIVHRGGVYGRYLPSGHLVYVREGTLFAAPFDVDRLETTGPPAPAVEGVAASNAGAQFTFSRRGTFVFVPGQSGAGTAFLHWMDAQGNLTPLRKVAADYRTIRFSPDGHRLAIAIHQGAQEDVWVYEWERGTLSRMTSGGSSFTLAWTPNGQRIAVGSSRAGKTMPNLYWQRADGTGETERLTESPNAQTPTSWHPSGKFLAFSERHDLQTQSDIMILAFEGDEVSGWKPGKKPSVFLNTPFNESEPVFSPDGHWLAYTSNESGVNEVYVRPFPGPGRKWLVSTDGGQTPVWSRSGKELFYWSGARSGEQIWVTSYAVEGDSFRAEKPRAWSPRRIPFRAGTARFDLHPDGKRFAVVTPAEETEVRGDKVVFITNFFDELRRIAPLPKR
jgi:Tol biopolymer transport system component